MSRTFPLVALLAALAWGPAHADSTKGPAAEERALLQKVRARRAVDRLAAVKELGQRKIAAAELLLARVAVGDKKKAVRAAAREALKQLPSRERADRLFVTVLEKSDDAIELTHAVQAVEAFPSDAAVEPMIALLQQTSGGFPRVHVAVARRRAYVADVEVNQTGVIPVLNPKLGKSTTGVVLETKIIMYFREALVRVLQKTTKQELGDDPKAWKRWWKQRDEAD